MTFKILNKRTNKVVERSAVCSALHPDLINLRTGNGESDSNAHDGHTSPFPYKDTPYNQWLREEIFTHPPSLSSHPVPADYGELFTGRPPDIVFSHEDTDAILDSPEYGESDYLDEAQQKATQPPKRDDTQAPVDVVYKDCEGNTVLNSEGEPIMIAGMHPDSLQGISFLRREPDGTRTRMRVVERRKGTPKERGIAKDKAAYNEFIVQHEQGDIDDIMAYNDIMNFIYRDQLEDEGYLWKFRKILGHQGPLTHRHKDYKNSIYNVEVEWENGEITFVPLDQMKKDDPVTLTAYAREHGLLDTPGWKSLHKLGRRKDKLERLIKQARLRSFRTAPKYKYGFQVPRTYDEAVIFDTRNGNTKWQDATTLEMKQLSDYDTFIDKGTFARENIPTGFKKITVHLIFDVKHDGRHKARLVAGGHLTDTPLNSVYAGVVSLRGLRMCIFLAELNDMEAYATDIGNAYLEATTQEKVCINAGSEFGALSGHLLIIHKALYGLRSSGKEFGDLLAHCLKELGFEQSRAESEIFMRESDGKYEYVATYVDDLCLVMKEPEAFLRVLQGEPYNFKLKGSGPMSFHLGCGFRRDEDGRLVMEPGKYIDKMMTAYGQLFDGERPCTKRKSPVEENDHPELDATAFLDEDGIQKYQSMVGSLQWLVAIGRWDIMTALMSLSSFRAQPRIGHLDRLKRIYGYVQRTRTYSIKYRVDQPDVTTFDNRIKMDWSKSIYGDHTEELPDDAPTPLGKEVVLLHYFDANLMHDVLSGKAVTGCIHFANKTPIMWHSKKQATTETATYGAEFVAGRTCIEHVIDLRNTFRYLGVPIHKTSYMFGDNESMINSSAFPYARLNKRHNILSYHYVRSQIARGYIALHHIRSHNNISDVVSKHWSYGSVKDLLKPIFNTIGNTAKLFVDDSPDCLDEIIFGINREAKEGGP